MRLFCCINQYLSDMGKKKRIAFRIISYTLSILLIISSVGIFYINDLLSQIDHNEVKGMESVDPTDIWEMVESEASLIDATIHQTDFKKQYDEVQSLELLQRDYIKNVLLIGCDSRTGSYQGNSDTMMLVSINSKTKKIHLVSFMRAMYVNIPKYGWLPLNSSYPYGGTALLISTIQNNFRIKIDDYAVINFTNFSQLIDMVGGLDIELTTAEANALPMYTSGEFHAGMNHLNGEACLMYARLRKIDTDFKRTARQRQVITAMINKAIHSDIGTLTNFAKKLCSLVNTSMSNSEIIKLAMNAGVYADYSIDQMMLPIENQEENVKQSGKYVGKMYIPFAGVSFEVWSVDYYTNVSAVRTRLLQ